MKELIVVALRFTGKNSYDMGHYDDVSEGYNITINLKKLYLPQLQRIKFVEFDAIYGVETFLRNTPNLAYFDGPIEITGWFVVPPNKLIHSLEFHANDTVPSYLDATYARDFTTDKLTYIKTDKAGEFAIAQQSSTCLTIFGETYDSIADFEKKTGKDFWATLR